MRLLYFSRGYTNHDRRFLLKFAESPHEVWFAYLEENTAGYEQRPLPPGIRLARWTQGQHPGSTPSDWLCLMPRFEALIEAVRPDVIHAGPVQSCGFLTALADFHPFVLMSWGSDILVDSEKDSFWRWLSQFTLARADMLVCDCDAVRARVRDLLGHPFPRVVQFPWGIDLEVFTPGPDPLHLRQQQGWEECKIVLSTRSWEPIYAIDTLLEAFRLARLQQSDLRLLLLGDGSMHSAVEQFIQDHHLERDIFRPGMICHDELHHYFRAADIYTSCCLSDGTSISLLEALATGLPVVVTDAPGNREWVISGENGWLAEANRAEAFAEALVHAAHLAPEARTRLAQTNRRLAETRANWDTNFSKLLNAYERREWNR